MKPKMTPAVLEYYRQIGSSGGRARARKYSKKKLKAWGNLGGKKPTIAIGILKCLKSGPYTSSEIADKTGLTVGQVSRVLVRLKRLGRMKFVDEKWQLPEKI